MTESQAINVPEPVSRAAQMRASNRRLGLIMLTVAAVFFFGVMFKYWYIR